MSIFNDVNTEADKDPIVEVKGVQVVDDNTIVIDGRGKSRPAIRNIAKKHFFGSENPERDEPGPGNEGGYFIGMHQLHYANVASVADGIIVASKKELGPKDTRPLAKKFVDSLNEAKEAEPKKLLVILNEESDDDIIVGGMGRTGILKEFYRLDEAKGKMAVFNFFYTDDMGRNEKDTPTYVVSVESTGDRKQDEKTARKAHEKEVPDMKTGFIQSRDDSNFSKLKTNRENELAEVKAVIDANKKAAQHPVFIKLER